ncbi:MAG TPA: DUF4389 domain-containing protein [Caldisericia bacterium]|nr:DUF4389 domain-containing protein [Caldisericia bacterium]HPF49388.1 DUF4389 domain-containing protein [Caldisericia bacterium]HPI84464.1 DUF4389 domain-containing protein [Caldisericia bacterium]HPQ93775.1 DUF4389 domain-containing protein [Caldisericia bacterium]HRV75661.1 DUF4389 domain-containing protein [Caldisericia bacterium]
MSDSPVKFDVEYPEDLSRGMLLLKTFFGMIFVGIPHGICLLFFGIGVYFALIYAWFAILFTGKYPRSVFEFAKRYQRWSLRVNAYWMFMMTDKYPPFNGNE